MAAELIVALDCQNSRQALQLANELKTRVGWVKIGLELFIAAGPAVVDRLKDLGFRIFLDLKLYDIPTTAIKAAEAIARLDVDMFTLHCQGGRLMCAGVAEALASAFAKPPLALGVTALTSFGDGEMPGIACPPSEFGLELAGMAWDWGLKGVICSAREARAIKGAYPDLICVCPGIRPARAARDDQSRALTPREAVKAGADYLVVGRPITRSPDVGRAAGLILSEMAATG